MCGDAWDEPTWEVEHPAGTWEPRECACSAEWGSWGFEEAGALWSIHPLTQDAKDAWLVHGDADDATIRERVTRLWWLCALCGAARKP